jgi:hypothetical protein
MKHELRRGVMNKLDWFAVTLTAGCLLCVADTVAAQEVGTIQATATVVSSLTIAGSQGLGFGTVTPGTPTSVATTAVGFAGQFDVVGSATAELQLTFTLPAALTEPGSGATLPVSFSSTDASYSNQAIDNQGSPSGSVDPNGPSTIRLSSTGTMFVWVGGTVSPGVSQTGGNYAEDVLLTVEYTGN